MEYYKVNRQYFDDLMRKSKPLTPKRVLKLLGFFLGTTVFLLFIKILYQQMVIFFATFSGIFPFLIEIFAPSYYDMTYNIYIAFAFIGGGLVLLHTLYEYIKRRKINTNRVFYLLSPFIIILIHQVWLYGIFYYIGAYALMGLVTYQIYPYLFNKLESYFDGKMIAIGALISAVLINVFFGFLVS